MPNAIAEIKRPFAIWLMPDIKGCAYLTEVITHLCKTYSGRPFKPHLTLISGLCSSIEQIISKLSNSIKSVLPLELSINKIDYSEDFFKALYIVFNSSKELDNTYALVKTSISENQQKSFLPHVSLLYSDIDIKQKKRIAQSITLDIITILFNTVSVVRPMNTKKGWHDIESWKIICKKKLSP